MRALVAVAGSIAQRPGVGGHAWVFLQYLLGFRRLGYDVLFVDRVEAGAADVRWVEDTMRRYGLGEDFAVLGSDGGGLRREEVLERLRRAVLLIDVMGFLDDEELFAAAPRRLFLDIDPGFPQLWQELGLHRSFGRHDAYATVGLRVGKEGSRVPTCGVEWIATPPPVVLEEWAGAGAGGASYTTVASWRGPFGPIEFEGERFGLRVHQMRRFAELPALTGLPLEVALEIDPADGADADLLRAGGWRVVAPSQVAASADDYRRYVENSRGEVEVAKDIYVRSRGGWVSDRVPCYLAAGRPVLAQATGFELEVETGAGLVAFATPGEAAAALEAIEAEYERHAAAARELARERFGSDRVLAALLEAAA
ncbi:MAG: hypothetical protein JSU06_04765 [Actinobacteria bacterium]|nr:hypothetical protein [Actinomycetota bacterium]